MCSLPSNIIKLLFIVLMFFFEKKSFSQCNLLQNGSFENYTSCPTPAGSSQPNYNPLGGRGQYVDSIIGWQPGTAEVFGPPSGPNYPNSPDYIQLNPCGQNNGSITPPAPFHGGAFVGLFLSGSSNSPHYKEYVATFVDLCPGKDYTLTLYVAKPSSGPSVLNNDLCVYGLNTPNLPVQATNGTVVDDCPTGGNSLACVTSSSITSSWQQFTLNFTPSTSYNAIIFGPECGTPVNPTGAGYVFIDSVTLTMSVEAPTVVNGPTNTCGIGTYTIDPIDCIDSYTWTYPNDWTLVSGGGALDTFLVVDVQSAGQLCVNGNLSCLSSTSTCLNITRSTPPTVSNLAHTCNSSTYTVSFDIAGGSPPYTVDGNASGSTYSSAPINSGVSYSFLVSDANGCDTTINGSFTCPGCLSNAGAMDSGPISLCYNDTTDGLHITTNLALDSNDSLRFALSPSVSLQLGGVLNWNSTPTFYFNPSQMNYSTTYYIFAVVGDYNSSNNGIDFNDPCFSSSNATPIVFNPPPTGSLSGNNTFCVGDSVDLSFQLSGTSPFQIIYSLNNTNPTSIVTNTSSYTLRTNVPGVYSIDTLIDGNGCTSTNVASTGIAHIPLPSATISGSDTICQGELLDLTIDLTGAGPWDIVYAIDGIDQSTITTNSTPYVLPVGIPGVYTITTVDDATICSAQGMGSATVLVDLPPTSNFTTSTDSLCDLVNVDFTNLSSNSDSCIWYIDGQFVPSNGCTNINHGFTTSGVYTVDLIAISDLKHCFDTSSIDIQINVNQSPVANFSFDPECADENNAHVFFTDLSIGGITAWNWNFGPYGQSTIQTPDFVFPISVPSADPLYVPIILMVSTDQGCSDSISLQACFEKGDLFVYVPNTFSPDGNSINDFFYPVFNDPSYAYDLYVFNRWGDIIFQSSETQKEWNGKDTQNNVVQEGAYVWMLQYYKSNEAQPTINKGHVIVRR